MPPELHRGRGALNNRTPQRFGLAYREDDGDWLDARTIHDDIATRIRTTVFEEHPRTILSFNQSPDIGFDRSVNAYRGCEHGCIYCYARPTHAYHDLSPGLDFETRLFVKRNAAELLRRTLARAGYLPRTIALGTNTDPYQPVEGRYRVTRAILELCLQTRHPLTITTKSDRVLRDLDILNELARHRLVAVAISVTSLDAGLSRTLEPRAPSPAKRLDALARLVDAGVPSHCMIAPIIPAVTDEFIEAIVKRAAAAGVNSAGWIMIRLPHEVAPLFREWLEVHFPDRAAKVMNIVRSIRGGRDNDPEFHSRLRPKGTWADLINRRFCLAAKHAGLSQRIPPLDITGFRAPRSDGQLDLFNPDPEANEG